MLPSWNNSALTTLHICFQNIVYKSFLTGNLIRGMNINRQFIIGRMYLDAFSVNNAIGSASNKHKVLGVYITIFNDLRISANRSTIQTVALIFPKDTKKYGLPHCLQFVIQELESLVHEGLTDPKTNNNLQFRVIASLGDNLGKKICNRDTKGTIILGWTISIIQIILGNQTSL